MNLQLEIVTPEKVLIKEEVNEIIAPTTTGEIAILPEHINMLTQLAPGEIIIKKGSGTQHLAVTGGFLEITNNKVSILADYAIRSEHIVAEKAIEAEKRAREKMKEAKEHASDRDFALAEAEFLRAITELKIANKVKHRQKSSV